MRKNILIIVLVLTIIILGALYWYLILYQTDNNQSESVSSTSETNTFNDNQINFLKAGRLMNNNPGMEKDVWYLIYEDPGKPALNVELKFDNNSVCEILGVFKPCSNPFNQGDTAGVQGNLKNGIVLVKILRVNTYTER